MKILSKRINRNIVRAVLTIISVAFIFCATACQNNKNNYNYENEGEVKMVTIEMKSGKSIKLELYPEQAPITVENFINLAENGFFDGIYFHRIIPGFVIQGGDPTGTGTGGSEQNIKGEFKANGVNNQISHKRGVISMARAGTYTSGFDTGSSQFFICLDDNTVASLDGYYAAFGKVVEGMDVVDEIAAVKTDYSDAPTIVGDEITIKTVTVSK